MASRKAVFLTVAWAVFGAGLLGAADPAAEDAVKKEFARLEGTWDLVPPEGVKVTPVQLQFASGKLTVIWPGDGSLPAAVKLYPDTTPTCIDVKFLKLSQESYEGIYQIEGDTLKLYVAAADVKERPTKFPEQAEPGNAQIYGVFKRQKN